MPDRHFYWLRHHIFFYIKFLLFCFLGFKWKLVFKLGMGIRDLPRILWFLIREQFRHKKIVKDADRKNKTPYINVSFLEFDFLESHRLLDNPLTLPQISI